MAYQQYYGATTSASPHGSYAPLGTPSHRVSISAGSSGTPGAGGSGSGNGMQGLLPAFDGSNGQGGMHPPATPMQQQQQVQVQGNQQRAGQQTGMSMAPAQMGQGQAQVQSMDSSMANTVVYTTQYIGAHGNVPVFEAMIRGIAVMMRRSDMWLNATQILKVAGVAKPQRTKMLEKDIAKGVHEKVQGGYGRYQGTWVPFEIGVNLANQFHVGAILAPIFNLRNNPHAAGVPAMPPASARQVSPSSRPTTGRTTGRSSRPSSSGTRNRPGSMDSPFTTTAMMNHIIDPNLGTPGMKAQGSVAPTPSPMRFDASQFGGMSTPAGSYQSNGQPGTSNQILQPQANGSGQNGDMAPPAVPAKRPYSDGSSGGAIDQEQLMMGGPYVDQYGRAYAPAQMPQQDLLEPAAKRMRRDTGDAQVADGSGAEVAVDEPSKADVSMADGGLAQEEQPVEEEAANHHAVPEGMRLSTKPHRPRNLTSSSGVTAANRNRMRLLAIFDKEQDTSFDISTVLSTPVKNADGAGDTSSVVDDLDIDQVIDDRGHTALHWATALARSNIVAQLLQKGADMHRGNFAGETPLIRAVLTTNNADANTLGSLIADHLHASLHTIDSSHRTVLHHVALIAGVKGRATSATAYMSACLEYLTRHESGDAMRAFVNVQDIHGDTALCVAARVGNKALVKLLLEAGADKAKANDLGFRPTDFGLDVPDLVLANGDAIRPAIKRLSTIASQKGDEVSQRFVDLINELNTSFKSEMALKHAQVEQIRGEVISATHELAEQRRQVSLAQARQAEYEEVQQKIANLQRALKDEDGFDWQSGAAGSAQEAATGAGAFNGTNGLLAIPTGSDPASDLPELRRLRLWYAKTADVANKRLEAIQGLSAEKAVQYSKVIAACVKVPVEKLDERLLDELIVAVESDGSALDSSKISAFLGNLSSTGP